MKKKIKILFYFILAVDLDGVKGNDTKEGHIMIGRKGIDIAKKISIRIKAAVENSSLSLNINGTEFVTDKYSFNILEPKQFCTKGQTFKEGYCRKYFFFRSYYAFDFGFVFETHKGTNRHSTKVRRFLLLRYAYGSSIFIARIIYNWVIHSPIRVTLRCIFFYLKGGSGFLLLHTT